MTLSESQRCGSCFCGCRRALSAAFSHVFSVSQPSSQPVCELRTEGWLCPSLLFEDDLGLKVKHAECFNTRSKFHALVCGVRLISHPSQRLPAAKASPLKV